MKNKTKHLVLDFLETLFIGVSVLGFVLVFLVEPLQVAGDSMVPSLQNNEQIVIEKLSQKFNEPKRGEVIVFKDPKNPTMLIVKRVIGISKDTIVVKNNTVSVNGKVLKENYIKKGGATKGSVTLTVPDGQFYLLGDNRQNSNDSRTFGTIKESDIVGRALMVYYPVENLRLLNNVDFLLPSGVVNKLNNTFDF